MGSVIRLSQLAGKNIVNIYDGVRLGVIQDSDLTFHTHSGKIESIIIPSRMGFAGLWSSRNGMQIPWEAVNKIGKEVIIVELGQSPLRLKRNQY